MSVAHRFGAEKYAVALVSRSSERHGPYLQSLADAGVEAAAFTGDVTDKDSLRHTVEAVRQRFGRIDVGYFGPMVLDSISGGDITTLDGAGAEEALRRVPPAVEFASLLIPELTKRGSGGLLFAGGMSSTVPMPQLGGAVLAAAAMRNYAVTLHAALAPTGVYAGTISIGGLIERSDLHNVLSSTNPALPTVNPDDLAEILWRLYSDRDKPEAVVAPDRPES
jgi:NAD(P)-dependent dehydrogenase (short-subunit alcohol dehydrogenase family)